MLCDQHIFLHCCAFFVTFGVFSCFLGFVVFACCGGCPGPHHPHHHNPYPGGCCTGEACLTAADDPAAPLNQAGRLVFAHAAPNCWAGLPMVSDPQPDAHWGHWLLANAPDRCMSVGGPSFAVGPLMTATAPTRCVSGVGCSMGLGGGHHHHHQPPPASAVGFGGPAFGFGGGFRGRAWGLCLGGGFWGPCFWAWGRVLGPCMGPLFGGWVLGGPAFWVWARVSGPCSPKKEVLWGFMGLVFGFGALQGPKRRSWFGGPLCCLFVCFSRFSASLQGAGLGTAGLRLRGMASSNSGHSPGQQFVGVGWG